MSSRQVLFGRLFACAALVIVALTGTATACPICFAGLTITPGQKIDSANDVVLAIPADGVDTFRIVETIKGTAEPGSLIVEPGLAVTSPEPWVMSADGPIAPANTAAVTGDKPLLLFRNRISERWTSLGTIGAEYADWLRRLAATNREGDEGATPRVWPQPALGWSSLSDAEWAERLEVVTPYLETDDPLAGEVAFGELARAPYGALRALRPALDAAMIRAWIEDAELAPRQAAYLLLLGIAGGPEDAVTLERRIADAWAWHDSTNLSAILAADLELRGPSRIEDIETMYFRDHERTLPEIQAALLALSVHGAAGGTIPRQNVVDAYRDFIRARPPMAGFVAKDLSDWNVPDAVPDYVDVIRSGVIKDPAEQFIIVTYLRQSSDQAAEAALAAIAEAGN